MIALDALRMRARRTRRAFARLPRKARLLILFAAVLAALAALNWAYQAVRKPSEVFSPMSGALTKTPGATWREYGHLFRGHSTPVITPELLAALAQVEGAGNPVATTYWRWGLSWNPFELYRPASSAVGMYQMTDGAFQDARRYCIRDHAVSESCWFNGFYTRVVPSHAVELTAVFLDRAVANVLRGPIRDQRPATLQQKQDLAAVIHLCGATAGAAYARRGFRPQRDERCGTHRVAAYLARVNAMKRQFIR
jgi:hypothetical protein